MSIKVHHSIIHAFEKDSDKPLGLVTKMTVLLDSELQGVRSLVWGMAALFGKKENSQEWGHFGGDGREGPFPPSFDGFVRNLDNGKQFLSLSHTILDEVTKLASEQKWATGGHVLCAIYEFVKNEAPAVAGNDDVEANAAAGNAPAAGGVEVAPEFDGPAGEMFFIVAMVKQRGGLTLDANLVPVGINEVDMSKLHQAALIRVGRYNTVKALPPLQEDSDDEHDRIYLSFVSQHANRGSSSYFIHALGCVVGVSPAKATTKLFAAVDAFFTERKPLLPYRRSAKERLTAHLQNASENGKPVTIDGLYELLIREVPPDLAEQVRDIAEFLNDERRQVPATFEVSKSVLTRFASVALNGEGYTVKFEKSLLGTDVNSDFHYDKEQKTLTIRNLSPDVTARLDKVLTGG